jgi:hypothetical protein
MKEYTLNKDAFHAKLQKYVFGHIPYENNFCPYFWLTIFCVLVIVPVFLFKTFVRIASVPYKAINKFFEYVDEKYCVPQLEKAVDALPNWKIYELFWLYDRGRLSEKRRKRDFKLITYWIMKMPSHNKRKEILKDYRVDWDKRQKEFEKLQKLKEVKRKNFHLSIIKYTKWLAPILLLAVIGGAGFGIYKLGILLNGWATENWDDIVIFFGISALLIVCAATICGLFHLCKNFISKTVCTACIPFKNTGGFLAKPFVFIAKSIVGAVQFFVLFFKTIKDDHCPAIKWEKK